MNIIGYSTLTFSPKMNQPCYNLIKYEMCDISEMGSIYDTVQFYRELFKRYRPDYQPVIEWMINLTPERAAGIGLWLYPFNHTCCQVYIFDKKTRIGGKYQPLNNHVYMVETYMETTYAQRQGEL